jgi:ribosome recycling factor
MHDYLEKVQELTDEYIEKIDKITETKEKEILED